MNKKLIILFLTFCIGISIFLHFYKINQVPPCINADEAAFSYNAYSILKTGKDEYGQFLPLRLQSFRDYKLPIYTYASIPFIAVFGLNDFSTRALNILIGILFVPLMFFLARELFKSEKVALLSAFLTSFMPGLYILSRHAHEGVSSYFFTLLSMLFLIRLIKKNTFLNFFLTNIFILAAAFSYHSGRLFLVFVILYQIYLFFSKKIKMSLAKTLILAIVLLFPFFTDIVYGVNRVQNLLFYKNIGFTLRINEYIGEHPNRLIHNKLTEAIRELTNKYFSQISPDFFITSGDKNIRFGFQNLGLITPIEYVFIFVGLYYLFKNREKYRYLLVLFLLISPINNILTWQDASIIRTYILLFLVTLISSYGLYNFFISLKDRRIFYGSLLVVFFLFIFYLYNNWDVYFKHYPNRAITVRAWQCGYKELSQYVKENYKRIDHFYITDRNGQPYIYLLYYFQYDPSTYQKQAKISAPDKYGFGQIDRFDKFDFRFKFDTSLKNSVFIGYPDEFDKHNLDQGKITKIKIGTEEMFWIYDNSI